MASAATKAQLLFQSEFGGVMFDRPHGMSDRNYDVAYDHLILGKTLEDISWKHELSRERVRQIVENVMRRAIDARDNPGQHRRFRPGLQAATASNDGRGLRSVSLVSSAS
jgi:hypothetical protein